MTNEHITLVLKKICHYLSSQHQNMKNRGIMSDMTEKALQHLLLEMNILELEVEISSPDEVTKQTFSSVQTQVNFTADINEENETMYFMEPHADVSPDKTCDDGDEEENFISMQQDHFAPVLYESTIVPLPPRPAKVKQESQPFQDYESNHHRIFEIPHIKVEKPGHDKNIKSISRKKNTRITQSPRGNSERHNKYQKMAIEENEKRKIEGPLQNRKYTEETPKNNSPKSPKQKRIKILKAEELQRIRIRLHEEINNSDNEQQIVHGIDKNEGANTKLQQYNKENANALVLESTTFSFLNKQRKESLNISKNLSSSENEMQNDPNEINNNNCGFSTKGMLVPLPIETLKDNSFVTEDCKTSRNRLLVHCPVCQKKFMFQSQLKMHMIVHSKIKPHKCQQCGKHFKRVLGLNKHVCKKNKNLLLENIKK